MNSKPITDTLYIIILLISSFITRFLWIYLVPTDPSNDFYLYYDYAVKASKGLFTQYDATYPLFPFKFGYPLIVSLAFRLFGTSVWVAKIVNVIVSVATALLLYSIALKIAGKRVGRIAGILYAFWPAQIMYTSVLASEHMFILFSLISVYFFIRLIQSKSSIHRNAYAVIIGISLAVSQFVRPLSLLYLGIYIFFIFFYSKWHELTKRDLISKGLIVSALIVTYLIGWTSLTSFVEGYTKVPISKSSSGFSFLVGTNFDSSGMYNQADANILEEFNYDVKKVHRESVKRAVNRIINYPIGFLNLMEKKFIIQWTSDNYGFYWSTIDFTYRTDFTTLLKEEYKQFQRTSQLYYLVILIFAFLSLIFLIRDKKEGNYIWIVFILVFLGTVGAFTLFEVQDRYHYPVIPFLIIMAGYGMYQSFEKIKLYRSTNKV